MIDGSLLSIFLDKEIVQECDYLRKRVKPIGYLVCSPCLAFVLEKFLTFNCIFSIYIKLTKLVIFKIGLIMVYQMQ